MVTAGQAQVEGAPEMAGRQRADVCGDGDGVSITQGMEVFDVDPLRLPGGRCITGWQQLIFARQRGGACRLQDEAYVVGVVDVPVDVAFVETHLELAYERIDPHHFFNLFRLVCADKAATVAKTL